MKKFVAAMVVAFVATVWLLSGPVRAVNTVSDSDLTPVDAVMVSMVQAMPEGEAVCNSFFQVTVALDAMNLAYDEEQMMLTMAVSQFVINVEEGDSDSGMRMTPEARDTFRTWLTSDCSVISWSGVG